MRVFVTGASGFIGAATCRALVAAGHDVAGLSRTVAPWRLRDVVGPLTILQGDFEEVGRWRDRLELFAPEAVAHIGWAGVANADRDAAEQVRNVGWTADLLQLARDCGAATFLGLGSQAEYGAKGTALRPADATEPTTLYGEAKLAAFRIAAKLAALSSMRFVWMRVLSTYGAGDHPHWMIPGLIRQLLARQRPALTPGEQLWDLLHVSDAADAIRLALETSAAKGVYVLGSGQAPPLRSTIETIRDEIDPALPLGFGDVPYGPSQVMRLEADTSALRRDLGWQPRVDLRTGLRETVAWYRANPWIFAERTA